MPKNHPNYHEQPQTQINDNMMQNHHNAPISQSQSHSTDGPKNHGKMQQQNALGVKKINQQNPYLPPQSQNIAKQYSDHEYANYMLEYE